MSALADQIILTKMANFFIIKDVWLHCNNVRSMNQKGNTKSLFELLGINGNKYTRLMTKAQLVKEDEAGDLESRTGIRKSCFLGETLIKVSKNNSGEITDTMTCWSDFFANKYTAPRLDTDYQEDGLQGRKKLMEDFVRKLNESIDSILANRKNEREYLDLFHVNAFCRGEMKDNIEDLTHKLDMISKYDIEKYINNRKEIPSIIRDYQKSLFNQLRLVQSIVNYHSIQ